MRGSGEVTVLNCRDVPLNILIEGVVLKWYFLNVFKIWTVYNMRGLQNKEKMIVTSFTRMELHFRYGYTAP